MYSSATRMYNSPKQHNDNKPEIPPSIRYKSTSFIEASCDYRLYLRSSKGFSTYSSSSSSSLGRVAGGEFVFSSDTGFFGSSPILTVRKREWDVSVRKQLTYRDLLGYR